MDGVGSWKNVGSGFAPSVTPAIPRATPSTSSANPVASRRPAHKQQLLFSRDRTPLVTPRDSTSTTRLTPVIQSKLSVSSSVPTSSNGRKPLRETVPNRINSSETGGKRRTLVFEPPDVATIANKPKPSQWVSSNSSNEDAQVSRSLLGGPNAGSTSRWKGKLSRQSTGNLCATSSSSSHQSTARRILDLATRRRGPTIEFDRDDVASDDDEMLGETQRRKRRRHDLGGWGRLELVDAEDEEMEVGENRQSSVGRPARRTTRQLDLYPSDEEESVSSSKQHGDARVSAPTPYVLSRLPPPRPSTHSRSQFRSKSVQSLSSTASAEDIQARLVPYKTSARVLVPDSDEMTPPEHDEHEGEEPETEADDDEKMVWQRGSEAGPEVLEGKPTGERSDDSGFVDMIDLSHSSSPAVPGIPHPEEDVDDLESIPDSQPSVASHLSHPLGSSPPRSSSSVTILEPVATLRPPHRRAGLQPTESGILMPPPPVNPAPRRRLRRGAPPRNRDNSPPLAPPRPTSSRVLVEDTQPEDRPASPSHPFLTSLSNPYRIFCEETQDVGDPEMEALRLWNEMHTRLPSDLPSLDSDQIVLPSPKPLRPSKTVAPPSSSIPLARPVANGDAVETTFEEGRGTIRASETATTGSWSSLALAWQGDKPLPSPSPPAPRQSRLTNYFSLAAPLDESQFVIEDSQAPVVAGLEMCALGRAVRDSIQGLQHGKTVQARPRLDVAAAATGQGFELETTRDEDDLVRSSPLSSLSPCLPRSSPSSPYRREHENDSTRDDDEGDDDDATVLESDPEEQGHDGSRACARRRRAPISPLGGRTTKFHPRYVLPRNVVEFEVAKDEEEEEAGGGGISGEVARNDEAEGRRDGSGEEESMWESYWTFGSAPAPPDGVDDDDDDDDNEERKGPIGTSKTVAEMLLDQAPEVDLPPGWYQNEDGELVRGEFCHDGDDHAEVGEL